MTIRIMVSKFMRPDEDPLLIVSQAQYDLMTKTVLEHAEQMTTLRERMESIVGRPFPFVQPTEAERLRNQEG